MADYTAESKFFTPEGLLRGPEAIRSFFVKLFEEFVKPGISFEMLRQSRVGRFQWSFTVGNAARHRSR